ncbi:MAG: cyclic nucleotide-binding domain-containing protein [Planctomycetota bacterium]|nr:cyclic nucleotide-binding domain-containing protein [Planctomycetota bacterium]
MRRRKFALTSVLPVTTLARDVAEVRRTQGTGAVMAKARSSLKFLKYADNVETFHAGDAVFRAGEPGTRMYIVKAGTVDLRLQDRTLETLAAGDVLGEMALLDNEPRSATAVAITDCQLVPINAERFQYLVRQTPYFAIEVLQIMARRLRRMDRALQSSSDSSATPDS